MSRDYTVIYRQDFYSNATTWWAPSSCLSLPHPASPQFWFIMSPFESLTFSEQPQTADISTCVLIRAEQTLRRRTLVWRSLDRLNFFFWQTSLEVTGVKSEGLRLSQWGGHEHAHVPHTHYLTHPLGGGDQRGPRITDSSFVSPNVQFLGFVPDHCSPASVIRHRSLIFPLICPNAFSSHAADHIRVLSPPSLSLPLSSLILSLLLLLLYSHRRSLFFPACRKEYDSWKSWRCRVLGDNKAPGSL